MDEGALGREYADGDVICRQGEQGTQMFVVQAGNAAVFREEGGGEVGVGELGAGDVFGEMAVFDQRPRSATVRAVGNARVLTLDKKAFLRRVHEDPSFAFRICQGMSRHIRNLDEELALLRHVTSRIFMVRNLLIVSRDRPELYEQLKRDFAEDQEVEVILDRRLEERRKLGGAQNPERRRSDRRSEMDGWEVRLSKPYRGERPHTPEKAKKAVTAPSP
jgi:CRP-like cAMP-binding protein